MISRRLRIPGALAAGLLATFASPAFAEGGAGSHAPPAWMAAPFVLLLLCIALLPLIRHTEHWWHHNKSKLIVAVTLAIVTLGFYMFLHGYHGGEPGIGSVGVVLDHAILGEFIPFMALLFCLYTIAGGIELSGDLEATPKTNAMFLAAGAGIASFVGTTGAAMLLIRPILRTNADRRHVVHTVLFFIFAVCNCGGLLLPIGDPPLFLGYLRGIPFTWTLDLWPEFLIVNGSLLLIYFVWDTLAYRKEAPEDLAHDASTAQPLRLTGKLNLFLLLGVVLCVALLDPTKMVPGTQWKPFPFMREGLMFSLAAISYFSPKFTPPGLRERAKFDFFAINEVACLFIGIFITMQVPLEILNDPATVAALGVDSPLKFFWFTGGLSAFLDNAPTYVVFFQTSLGLPPEMLATFGSILQIPITDQPGEFQQMSELLLKAISCGAVFMGALTYIGNGPNFLVKAIAEQSGVKMPSFFGYMAYSFAILVPLFVIIGFAFFV